MVSILKNYEENDGFYKSNPFLGLVWGKTKYSSEKSLQSTVQPIVKASSIYSTLQALLQMKRPDMEAG